MTDFSVLSIPNRIFPVFYLEGTDDTIINECYAELKQKLNLDTFSDFNMGFFEGAKSLKADSVISALSELPFLAPYRIIVLSAFQRVSPEEKEKIANFVKDGIGKSIFIILSNTSEQKGRVSETKKKSENDLKKAGAFIDCRINDKNWNLWVRQYLKKFKIDIDFGALGLLKVKLGLDFGLAISELKKLQAYTYGKKKITAPDVEAVVSVSSGTQIYNISNCIVKGDSAEALKLYYKMIGTDTPSISFLMYLKRFFDGVAEVKALQESGMDYVEISKELKKHEFVIKKNLEIASSASKDVLAKISEIILDSDFNFKSGQNEKLVFDLAIYRISALFKK